MSSLFLGCSCQGDITGGGGEDPDLASGGEVPDGGKPALAQLAALTVTPPSASLSIDDLAVRKVQAFRAMGRFTDGRADQDVTALVNWRLDNQDIGSIDGAGDGAGVFTSSNQAGGRATLTASSGAVSGTARIEVSLQPIVRAPDAPPDADVLLPPTDKGVVMTGRSPVIVYPSDKTLFPRNIYKVLFQWNTGMGNDLFRLEFRGDLLNLSIYTTRDRFEPSPTQWAYLASTAAGGKLTWTVYGVNQKSPGQVWASTPVELGFTRGSVEGAIYYWSTTVAGVRRATVSDAAPQDFLTPTQTGKCVACHTLSRNGKRLAADVGGHTLGVVEGGGAALGDGRGSGRLAWARRQLPGVPAALSGAGRGQPPSLLGRGRAGAAAGRRDAGGRRDLGRRRLRALERGLPDRAALLRRVLLRAQRHLLHLPAPGLSVPSGTCLSRAGHLDHHRRRRHRQRADQAPLSTGPVAPEREPPQGLVRDREDGWLLSAAGAAPPDPLLNGSRAAPDPRRASPDLRCARPDQSVLTPDLPGEPPDKGAALPELCAPPSLLSAMRPDHDLPLPERGLDLCLRGLDRRPR